MNLLKYLIPLLDSDFQAPINSFLSFFFCFALFYRLQIFALHLLS